MRTCRSVEDLGFGTAPLEHPPGENVSAKRVYVENVQALLAASAFGTMATSPSPGGWVVSGSGRTTSDRCLLAEGSENRTVVAPCVPLQWRQSDTSLETFC